MSRSPIFDGVDPALLALIQSVGEAYGPYGARITSGYRPGDKRQHGRGNALDVELYDKKTNAALENYQDASTATAYQAFANAVRQQALKDNPALAEKLRWGGYFSGGPGKYGALDLMHFDTAGGPGGIGMAGGSWEGGWTPEMLKTWNIAAQGGGSPDDVKARFLAAIASGESPGYDVLYGGERFSDMSKHPGRMMPILDDQGQVTGHSDAAGKYQFIGSTWEEQAKKYGYKDFSPETQDTAAWNYANDIYKQKTGGDLTEALASNDPARVNAAAQILSGTWSSLPGGKEQAKAYAGGGKTFWDVYNAQKAPSGTINAAGGTGGGGGAFPAPPSAPDKKENPWAEGLKEFGKGVSGVDISSGKFGYDVPPQPAAARIDAEVSPFVSPDQADMQRQALAAAMARLNAGKLW